MGDIFFFIVGRFFANICEIFRGHFQRVWVKTIFRVNQEQSGSRETVEQTSQSNNGDSMLPSEIQVVGIITNSQKLPPAQWFIRETVHGSASNQRFPSPEALEISRSRKLPTKRPIISVDFIFLVLKEKKTSIQMFMDLYWEIYSMLKYW